MIIGRRCLITISYYSQERLILFCHNHKYGFALNRIPNNINMKFQLQWVGVQDFLVRL